MNGYKELSPPDVSSDEGDQDDEDVEIKPRGATTHTITLASGKKIQQERAEEKECCPSCPTKLTTRKAKMRAFYII